MTLYLDERISKETVIKVAEFYDRHPRLEIGSPISLENYTTPVIYFSSGGGDFNPSQVITDMINSRPDTLLIGARFLGSSAFEIFFNATCHRKLLQGTLGMMHQSTSSIELNENGQPCYREDTARKILIKNFLKPRTLELCKNLGMTEKETLQIVKHNNDLYFQPERMAEFLKISDDHIQNKKTAQLYEMLK